MKIRQPNLSNIPFELTDIPHWVVWKARRKENGKIDKPPYDPKSGNPASHSNPKTWATFKQAVNCYQNSNGTYAGIGYVFSKEDPFCGIDLDDCRDPKTGEIKPWAKDILEEFNSYSEVSPSNMGVKVFVKGNLSEGGRKQGNIEIYNKQRFFTMTGGWLGDYSGNIESREEQVTTLYDSFKPDIEKTPAQKKPSTAKFQDKEIIDKALSAKNGEQILKLLNGNWEDYPSQSEADQALCNHLAFYCGSNSEQIDRIFRKSGLMRDKWDKKHFGDGRTYGQATINKAIAGAKETYSNSKPETQTKHLVNDFIPQGIFPDYADYTKAFSESPVEFHVFTLAHTISSLIERGRFIQQGEDTIYPNLFTAMIAPSSLFKKSSSTGLYTKFLGRMDHLESKYIGHIGSPEGLFSGLKDNKGTGFLYYSEMGSLLAATNKKWMVDVIDILNDLYDCPDYYTKRLQSGPKSVRDVFLNLLCATQLDSMTAHIKESALLSGFLPRFTTVYSENLRPHMVRRPSPDIKLQNRIMKQLNAIRQATAAVKPMTLTSTAWSIFEAWAQDRHKEALGAPPGIQPMYGRLETHTLKYGIIIAVAENPKGLVIGEADIKKAITWAEFVLNSYRRLVMEELTFTMEDKKLKKVVDIVKGKGEASHRDVVIGTRYKPRELTEILVTLKAMGKIKGGKGPKGGTIYKWTG